MSDLTTYTYHMECLLRVLVYIEDHLAESLALEKLAKIAHISPCYFHRLFHAYMGKTLTDYVTELRLQRAAERLQYSDTSITDIAFDIGYETPSSFTKVFNQVMGQSPRQYRKAMQPLVRDMIARTMPTPKQQKMLAPEYVTRKDTPVLFYRCVGDYRDTPTEAFETLLSFLKEHTFTHEKIQSYYSIGLDDPHIVSRTNCRFDACVEVKEPLSPKGEIGKKIIKGGHFALFIHRGSTSEIETAFDAIFRLWYPSSKVTLTDDSPFCEHVNFAEQGLSEEERITKLYIPLKETL